MKTWWIILMLGVFLVSCATWKKKPIDKNNFVGIEAENISSSDMDQDNKGSDGGEIDGLSTVYFSYDKSLLSEDTKKVLLENITWIQGQPKVVRVELEGHCDTMGSEAYNIGLGRRRAETVKNFLISKGITKPLSIVSYGEERPISDMDHSKNRRVNFVPIY